MNVNQFLGNTIQPTITKTSGIVGQDDEIKTEDGKGYQQFTEIFKKAFDNLEATQQVVAKDNYDIALGNMDNLHQAMINSEKAATALELTTQITSRAVSAYNEIMRMQI